MHVLFFQNTVLLVRKLPQKQPLVICHTYYREKQECCHTITTEHPYSSIVFTGTFTFVCIALLYAFQLMNIVLYICVLIEKPRHSAGSGRNRCPCVRASKDHPQI